MSIFDLLQTDRIICPDSVDRALVEVSTPGWEGDGRWRVPMLGRRADLPVYLRRQVLANEAAAEAVPAEAVGDIDAEAVAAWITGRYPDAAYSAVVLGSPHGAAVHLAAALGAAWLPTSFPVSVRWPGGSAGDWPGALDWGSPLAATVVAGNPAVSVRQVHDPVTRGPLCASTVTLRLRWRALPGAYRKFLESRLRPGGSALLLRDLRTWPVLDAGPYAGFQIGSPATGLTPTDYRTERPSFRRLLDDLGADAWPLPFDSSPQDAETAGDPAFAADLEARSPVPTHGVLYRSPELLSAGVADLLRDHLAGDATGCLIEMGRLLDPPGVLARGLVPYWCESASLRAFTGAERWLAGSEPFPEVTVLPESPGTDCAAHAGLRQWRSLTCFATREGRLDRLAAGRYPLLPLAVRHAARVAAESGAPRPAPPHLTVPQALDTLRTNAAALGLLVS